MKNKVYYIFLLLFVGIVMIDPTGMLLHLKDVAFLGILCLSFLFSKVKLYKDIVITYYVLMFMALLSICFGTLIFNSNLDGSISYFKALMFGLIFITISRLSVVEILKLNYYVGLSLSSFISVLIIAYISGLFNLSWLIERMSETVTIMIAKRDLLGFDTLMFFYKTMPFCFFALIYALRGRRFVPAIIILAPIIYGGSRTPMLVALAIVLYLLYDRRSKYLRLAMGIVGFFSLIYIVLFLTSPDNSQGGDEIKGSVASYLLHNSSIVGQGVGVSYWDAARGRITTTTEMTYFEMLYQYGWLLFPFVLFIFVRPFFVMYKKNNDVMVKDFAIAYLLYLVNAGTNPLLISSTGMWVFACALTIAAKLKEGSQLSEREIQDCALS